MPILVDGHNLIGRLPALSLHDPDDEEKLIQVLQVFRTRKRKAMTVVFDPGESYALPASRRQGGVEVVYAPHGSSADAIIVQRVQRSRRPDDWLVVTSDRLLAEKVTRLGARVQSSEAFAAELDSLHSATSAWKDRPLSPAEVEKWLALFGSQERSDVVDSSR